MKLQHSIFVAFILLFSLQLKAQTGGKEYKAGHVFYITLPDYMSRTVGLNSAAVIQFKNAVKDVYGFVIEDNKEELEIAEMKFSSLSEFHENFMKDFLKDEEKRKVSKANATAKGATSFIESDITYYDKDAQTEIYYYVGMAETKDAYYKMLCWCTKDNKDKFREDFKKMLLSIRD